MHLSAYLFSPFPSHSSSHPHLLPNQFSLSFDSLRDSHKKTLTLCGTHASTTLCRTDASPSPPSKGKVGKQVEAAAGGATTAGGGADQETDKLPVALPVAPVVIETTRHRVANMDFSQTSHRRYLHQLVLNLHTLMPLRGTLMPLRVLNLHALMPFCWH
jgi:hypothetical protein